MSARPGTRTPPEGTRTPPGAEVGQCWEGEMANCGSCGMTFGKGPLVRRHHCRICGRCVCSECSPNKIVLEDWKGLQRVCTPCVAVAPRAHLVRGRVALIGDHLHAMHEPSAAHSSQAKGPATLEDAVSYCETCLVPMKLSQSQAISSVQAATEKLQALAVTDLDVPARSLGEAVESLEKLLFPVELRIRDLEAQLQQERTMRERLELKMRKGGDAKGSAGAAGATGPGLVTTEGEDEEERKACNHGCTVT